MGSLSCVDRLTVSLPVLAVTFAAGPASAVAQQAESIRLPDIVVTAEKAREWQRMFDHAAAFCEQIYGEKISMEGIRQSTMTCLALETLPLPVYDIMGM